MADDDADDFEDDDDLEMTSDWTEAGCVGSVDLDADWVTYLASADPPHTTESVDLSIPDFEDDADGAGEQETRYA